MSKSFKLGKPVTLHAWNADRTLCAVVHNDSNVVIYGNTSAKGSAWEVKYTLSNHDQLVSGLDWCHAHNKIVTCSHDRNAFVFTLDESTDKWTAGLVLLRLTRGCTGAWWSPDGDKFIVTSAYKEVRVCTYDPENDWWWPSDDIKKADKSTVLAAAWHPNSQLIATGSAKKVCRVFSAYIDETDDVQDAGPFAEGEVFGTNIIDFDAPDGWVESVAWSHDGYSLVFSSHDSTLYFATFARDGTSTPTIQAVRGNGLPHTRVLFLNDKAVVATGHDMTPQLFKLNSDGLWEFKKNVDKKVAAEATAASSRAAAARSMFSARTTLGHSGDAKAEPHFKHRHSIQDLRVFEAGKSGVTKYSTCCTGGKIVVWDV